MTTRTTRTTVQFLRPFMLSGIGVLQPAGTHSVETDEELVQEISFPVYRRTSTVMLLPAQSGGAIPTEMATINPLELELALKRDAAEDIWQGPDPGPQRAFPLARPPAVAEECADHRLPRPEINDGATNELA